MNTYGRKWFRGGNSGSGLRKKFRQEKGFTLIEMLTVTGIIAILTATSIPMVNSSLDKAKHSADASNERAAEAAAMTGYLLGTVYSNHPYIFDAYHGRLLLESEAEGTGIIAYGRHGIHNEDMVIEVIVDNDGEITNMHWKNSSGSNYDLCSKTDDIDHIGSVSGSDPDPTPNPPDTEPSQPPIQPPPDATETARAMDALKEQKARKKALEHYQEDSTNNHGRYIYDVSSNALTSDAPADDHVDGYGQYGAHNNLVLEVLISTNGAVTMCWESPGTGGTVSNFDLCSMPDDATATTPHEIDALKEKKAMLAAWQQYYTDRSTVYGRYKEDNTIDSNEPRIGSGAGKMTAYGQHGSHENLVIEVKIDSSDDWNICWESNSRSDNDNPLCSSSDSDGHTGSTPEYSETARRTDAGYEQLARNAALEYFDKGQCGVYAYNLNTEGLVAASEKTGITGYGQSVNHKGRVLEVLISTNGAIAMCWEDSGPKKDGSVSNFDLCSLPGGALQEGSAHAKDALKEKKAIQAAWKQYKENGAAVSGRYDAINNRIKSEDSATYGEYGEHGIHKQLVIAVDIKSGSNWKIQWETEKMGIEGWSRTEDQLCSRYPYTDSHQGSEVSDPDLPSLTGKTSHQIDAAYEERARAAAWKEYYRQPADSRGILHGIYDAKNNRIELSNPTSIAAYGKHGEHSDSMVLEVHIPDKNSPLTMTWETAGVRVEDVSRSANDLNNEAILCSKHKEEEDHYGSALAPKNSHQKDAAMEQRAMSAAARIGWVYGRYNPDTDQIEVYNNVTAPYGKHGIHERMVIEVDTNDREIQWRDASTTRTNQDFCSSSANVKNQWHFRLPPEGTAHGKDAEYEKRAMDAVEAYLTNHSDAAGSYQYDAYTDSLKQRGDVYAYGSHNHQNMMLGVKITYNTNNEPETWMYWEDGSTVSNFDLCNITDYNDHFGVTAKALHFADARYERKAIEAAQNAYQYKDHKIIPSNGYIYDAFEEKAIRDDGTNNQAIARVAGYGKHGFHHNLVVNVKLKSNGDVDQVTWKEANGTRSYTDLCKKHTDESHPGARPTDPHDADREMEEAAKAVAAKENYPQGIYDPITGKIVPDTTYVAAYGKHGSHEGMVIKVNTNYSMYIRWQTVGENVPGVSETNENMCSDSQNVHNPSHMSVTSKNSHQEDTLNELKAKTAALAGYRQGTVRKDGFYYYNADTGGITSERPTSGYGKHGSHDGMIIEAKADSAGNIAICWETVAEWGATGSRSANTLCKEYTTSEAHMHADDAAYERKALDAVEAAGYISGYYYTYDAVSNTIKTSRDNVDTYGSHNHPGMTIEVNFDPNTKEPWLCWEKDSVSNFNICKIAGSSTVDHPKPYLGDAHETDMQVEWAAERAAQRYFETNTTTDTGYYNAVTGEISSYRGSSYGNHGLHANKAIYVTVNSAGNVSLIWTAGGSDYAPGLCKDGY